MRVIVISAFALAATGSCAGSSSRVEKPADAITSLATALAKAKDTYDDIISKKQMAGFELWSDNEGSPYFRYGVLGRCYPRDNSRDLADDNPATRSVDEVTCLQSGAFDVSDLTTSFGRIFLRSPHPDETPSFPPNIPGGERVYRFGTEDNPSDVGVELTTTGPVSFAGAVFKGNRFPVLSDELMREYRGKLKVREVKLWRR